MLAHEHVGKCVVLIARALEDALVSR